MDDTEHTEMSREEFERLAGPEVEGRWEMPQTPAASLEAMVESLHRLMSEEQAA